MGGEQQCTCMREGEAPCRAHEMLAPGFRERYGLEDAGGEQEEAKRAGISPGGFFVVLHGSGLPEGAVRLRCQRCGTALKDLPNPDLAALNERAARHVCGPVLPASVWARAAQEVQDSLARDPGPLSPLGHRGAAIRAFRAGLEAVWGDVREAVKREGQGGS